MTEPIAPAPIWKRVAAATLDFIMVFFLGGYAIGKLTGQITPEGFNLSGLPALALLALIVIYFYVGRRIAMGTLWDRFLGIGRPQPYK